jgi:hypothetical protein
MRVWWRAAEVSLVDLDIAGRTREAGPPLHAPTPCVHSIVECRVVSVSSAVQEAAVLQRRVVIKTEVKERRVRYAVSDKCKSVAMIAPVKMSCP